MGKRFEPVCLPESYLPFTGGLQKEAAFAVRGVSRRQTMLSLSKPGSEEALAAASQVTVLKLFRSVKLQLNLLYNKHVLK